MKTHVRETGAGWSNFQLENTSVYCLSYLTDIASGWLDAAIYGLVKKVPFCVKGYLEPNRVLCTVSYNFCCITVEDEDTGSPLDEQFNENQKHLIAEYSPTSMIQFCEMRYEDIYKNLDAWANFICFQEKHEIQREKNILFQKLLRLTFDCLKKKRA